MFSIFTKTISSAPVVYFDCDDTLVMWGRKPSTSPEGIWVTTSCRRNNERLFLVPHAAHVKRLRDLKQDGASIIVWSRGGGEWAFDVVSALGLTDVVDACIPKPDICYDDLPRNEIIPETTFLPETP